MVDTLRRTAESAWFQRTITGVILVDSALREHEVVWAAAGTPDAVFPIAPARLAEVVGARTIRVIPDPAAGS